MERTRPTTGSDETSSAVQIEGRRAAVTGAAGFIGAAVCRRLAREGAEVIGIEVNPEMAAMVRAAGIESRVADVADAQATVRALSDAEIVVHTAALVREWGSMHDFIPVNVRGTVNVLDAADAAGAERVVHLSTVAVYGYEAEGELDESAFHRTVGMPYIDTKGAADGIARRRGAIVVRPGDVYGPGSVPWLVRPSELLRIGQLSLPGKGDGAMLPVYIDDLVEAILLAVQRGRPGLAYTIWDGSPITFHDYFSRLADLVDGRPPRKLPRAALVAIASGWELIARIRGRPPSFGRHGITYVDRRGSASNRRACEELGWRPQVSLDEGLSRSGEWLRGRTVTG
jgi:nucleoside-diphosphate-sugar epimerase